MKALLFTCLISTNLIAMHELSKPIEDSLKSGIDFSVKKASELPNHQSNGALKVMLGLQQKLVSKKAHQLPSAPLTKKLLIAVISHPQYEGELKKVKEASSAQNQNSETALNASKNFRRFGANVIADAVEKQSKVKFNRDQSKMMEFFTNNQDIKPDSEDAQYIEASTIALFALHDLQAHAMSKKS